MKESMEAWLNLATWCKDGTTALGPGKRLAVWTQGCMKRCPGCISPEFRELKRSQCVDVAALAAYAVQRKEFDGLTVSGGEPFLQALALARLVRAIKVARPDMTCIVFTGFYLGELIWNEAIELLAVTDLLIDGPFVQEKVIYYGLRGSSNQHFHFLTDALKTFEDELTSCNRIREIHCDGTGLFPVGIPAGEGVFGNIFDNL